STQLNVPAPRVNEDAMALLAGYNWPGNIRELQNVVERAVLLSDGQTIGPAQLPREVVGDGVEPSAGQGEVSLWGYEKALIIKALKDNGWTQTRAARSLGISRDNLRYRIKKFEIERPA